ncbi:hypothetical protein MAIT1_02879 [Magnetofaba australis IT-1]|uniref:Uncharacterized protein n=1 Tax=Magnetofaba australis IT-1 TaxID=1434232 RepID=A0A1Y2K576_9PROT|nr:hypothetical protein MAIT1_02879 [Magnetofaba australis IT-1]
MGPRARAFIGLLAHRCCRPGAEWRGLLRRHVPMRRAGFAGHAQQIAMRCEEQVVGIIGKGGAHATQRHVPKGELPGVGEKRQGSAIGGQIQRRDARRGRHLGNGAHMQPPQRGVGVVPHPHPIDHADVAQLTALAGVRFALGRAGDAPLQRPPGLRVDEQLPTQITRQMRQIQPIATARRKTDHLPVPTLLSPNDAQRRLLQAHGLGQCWRQLPPLVGVPTLLRQPLAQRVMQLRLGVTFENLRAGLVIGLERFQRRQFALAIGVEGDAIALSFEGKGSALIEPPAIGQTHTLAEHRAFQPLLLLRVMVELKGFKTGVVEDETLKLLRVDLAGAVRAQRMHAIAVLGLLEQSRHPIVQRNIAPSRDLLR